MIQIDTIIFDNDMPIISYFNELEKISSSHIMLDGNPYIQEYESNIPKEIVLKTDGGSGLQKKETVDKLKALAGSGVYKTYNFTYISNGIEITAVVRFKTEEIAVNFQSVYFLSEIHSDDFWFAGEIKLQVVSNYELNFLTTTTTTTTL